MFDRHVGMTIAGGVSDAQYQADVMRYNTGIGSASNKKHPPVEICRWTIL